MCSWERIRRISMAGTQLVVLKSDPAAPRIDDECPPECHLAEIRRREWQAARRQPRTRGELATGTRSRRDAAARPSGRKVSAVRVEPLPSGPMTDERATPETRE